MKESIVNIINIVYVSYGIFDWFNIFILFKFIFKLNIVRRVFLKLLNFFILFVLWNSMYIIVVNEINNYRKIKVKGMKFFKNFDFIMYVKEIRFLLNGEK